MTEEQKTMLSVLANHLTKEVLAASLEIPNKDFFIDALYTPKDSNGIQYKITVGYDLTNKDK